MSSINHTEILIRGLDGGSLQRLAYDLIPKIRPDIVGLIHSGAMEGTIKTRKGTPDIWGKTKDGSIVYISVTADSHKGKMYDDVEKSIEQLKDLKIEKGALCIAFLNFEPQHEEVVKCEKYCEQHGCRFEIINNSKISSTLNFIPYHGLRLKYLGLPPSTTFIGLDDFQESIIRRSVHLKFSANFMGRERDMACLVEEATNGKRVLILYGNPGVGKTRFSMELVKRLLKEDKFSRHIPVVLNIDGLKLGQGLQELDVGERYILVVDDANRMADIGILSSLLTDPARIDGSIIIMNVRGYGLDKVQTEINSCGLDGVISYSIENMKNADIDELIKGEPFNIKSSDFRERIIANARGNPRLASMLAEVVKQGGIQKVLQPFEIYEQYFKSVFSELEKVLDHTYEEKVLLALISALRSINLNDKSLITKIIELYKFKDENHIEYLLGELDKYEIIDRLPSGIVKIFDDSVSEYVFYRYCLSDRSVATLRIILENFMGGYADEILENLTVLVLKGYKSDRLDEAFVTLLTMAEKSLMEESNQRDRLVNLEWMSVYAGARPDECLAVITKFWRMKKEDISWREAKCLVSVIKTVYRRSWYKNFTPLVETLWEFANSGQENHNGGRQEAIEFLCTAFKYIPPYEVKEGDYRLVYSPQSFILSQTDTWLKGVVSCNDIKLIVKMLAQVCANHYSNDHMSPIDDNTFVMQSGPLVLIPDLVKIRKTTFNQLLRIYREQDRIDVRLEILNALRSPFEPLPLGGVSLSKKLAECDSELLIPVLNEISQIEENLLLKNKLLDILDLIRKHQRSDNQSTIRTMIMTEELVPFQMFGWPYWHKKGLNFDGLRKAQGEYSKSYAVKFTLENYLDIYHVLKVWESWYKLDGKASTLIGNILTKVGRLNPHIGALLIKYIEQDDETFNPEHARAILIGIGWRNADIEGVIYANWVRKKDVGKCQVVASALGGGSHLINENDKPLINELVSLGNDIIDRILVNILVAYMAVDDQWVIDILLSISNRCTEDTYNELLSYLVPRGGYSYNIYDTRYEMFKKLIYGTIRLPSLNRLSFNLGTCLKLLSEKEGISVIYDYLKARVDQKSISDSQPYELLPEPLGEREYFSFISQIENYDRLFESFMIVAADSTNQDEIYDMLAITLGDDNNPAVSPVLYKFIDKRGTLIDLLTKLPVTDQWYDLVDKIVQVTHDSAKLSRLYEAFEGRGAHWGSVEENFMKIVSELEAKKALYANDPNMLMFLNGAQNFYREKAETYKRIIWRRSKK